MPEKTTTIYPNYSEDKTCNICSTLYQFNRAQSSHGISVLVRNLFLQQSSYSWSCINRVNLMFPLYYITKIDKDFTCYFLVLSSQEQMHFVQTHQCINASVYPYIYGEI